MPIVEKVWLAALTRDADDAGSDADLNLVVNIDGEDVLDTDYTTDQSDSDAMLFDPKVLDPPLDLTAATHSSIRLGVRGDDAWGPQHVLLFAETPPGFTPGRTMALAMETDLPEWLSTDPSEGPLTIPLRLVSPGDSDTLIHRVLFIVDTAWSNLTGDTETESPIELEVTVGGAVVLRQEIADTSQSDLERGVTNWYEAPALVPSPAARSSRTAASGSASWTTTPGGRPACSYSAWTPRPDDRRRWSPWSPARASTPAG